jgi:hypothetical protein
MTEDADEHAPQAAETSEASDDANDERVDRRPSRRVVAAVGLPLIALIVASYIGDAAAPTSSTPTPPG